MRRLSIIIPTLNEAAQITLAITQARDACRGVRHEVIVSDCASTDGTLCMARACADAVTNGACSRATALNNGSRVARGDVLLFLHADTRLPPDAGRAVAARLHQPDVVGGAFDFAFGEHAAHCGLNRQTLRVVRFCNRVRFSWNHHFFGDQAIFCRRSTFDRIGGFPQQPLFEDVRFSRRMTTLGRTAIITPPAQTSPRRFIANCVVRQGLTDAAMLFAFELGFTPRRLWEAYNALNRREH
ncbi:MAG: TIGR04283 family arsenosugar biosynthesis glycosyltransferase [Phycisphaerae bacterium]